MTGPNASRLARAHEIKELACAVILEIEKNWECVIEVDLKILEEAVLRAEQTLNHVGIDAPNHIKQAGHFAFWIRKLKPIRVMHLRYFQEIFAQMVEGKLIKGKMDDVGSEDTKPRARYVNEIFALSVALAILKKGMPGIRFNLNPAIMNDLAVSMRYHSFSPSAMSAILEARIIPRDAKAAAET